MTWLRWAGLLAVVLMFTIQAEAQTSASPDLSQNAALYYWRAITYYATQKDVSAELETIQTAWLDEKATPQQQERLLELAAGPLELLHKGASIRACDWGTYWEGGPYYLSMSHLGGMRRLARLAEMRSRYRFEHGDSQAAVADLLAIWTAGRHVGQEPLLINGLVDITIEYMAIEDLAKYLPRLDSAALSRLAADVRELPPAPDLSAVILGEKRLAVTWPTNKLKAGDTKAVLRFMRQTQLSDSSPEHEVGQEDQDREKIQRYIDQCNEIYDALAQAVALPYAQRGEAMDKLAQRYSQTDGVEKGLLSNMPNMLLAFDRLAAKNAMLQAAIAYRLRGEAGLQEVKDPFGDGPFKLHKLEGEAFELSSARLVEDKPLTLRVGQPSGGATQPSAGR